MTELGPEPVYEVETCTCLELEGDDETCPVHNEVSVLERRRQSILDRMDEEPLTKAQADAVIEELAEIETSIQKFGGAMDDISDAKLCASFGNPL
jgi:hypothetical protein